MKYIISILILFSLASVAHAVSLDFTNGSNHVVTGSSASNLESAFTMWGWIQLDTSQTNAGIIGKPRASDGIGKACFMTGTFKTRINIVGQQPGSIADAQSNNGDLRAGTWFFLACTWDGNAGGPIATTSIHIYLATATSSFITETTYSSRAGATSSATSTSSGAVLAGQRTAAGTGSIDGRIAAFGVHSVSLAPWQLNLIRLCPALARLPGFGLEEMHFLGERGTGTHEDKSGNGRKATVTGAVYSPLSPPILRGWCSK